MQSMRPFLYLFLLIGIIIAGIGVIFFKKNSTAILPQSSGLRAFTSFGTFLKANYSFLTDTDLDGLSDAKEIIYGSDPLKSDTDNDGFSDGKEVSSGFDPLVAGKGTGRLSERKNFSLTVQYFSWLKEKTGDQDPKLNETDISEFLKEKGLLSFSLPLILENDIKFTNDDPQKIADYLKLASSLTLPGEGSPYLALAGELIKNRSFDAFSRIIKTLKSQTSDLAKASVPPMLIDLHRSYFGIWQELENIFNGLKESQTDPVLIYLNQKKGEWLVEKIQEAEKLRAELIAKIKLMPFQ